MLRKDLLPGDVFHYKFNLPQVSYYVDKIVDGQPKTRCGESSTGKTLFCEEEVSLLWRDPILGGLQNQPETGPKHYTSQIPEPIDAIEGWGLNFRLGAVVKYIARAGKKDGVPASVDLQKAIRFLARELNALEGVKSWKYEVK